jgi:hypothetical protein
MNKLLPCLCRCAALLPLLVLAACFANTGVARVTADYAATVRKVGLVSLIDAQPNLSHLTSSAMESTFALAALPGWDADALVRTVAGQRLGRKGYEVVHLPADDALRALYDSDRGYPRTERIHEAVYALGAAHGLDMIVLVCRQVGADEVTGTNQMIRGYGLQRAFDGAPKAYALVYVEAVDTRKRFVVGKAAALQQAPLSMAAWQPGFESARGTVPVDPAHREEVAGLLRKVLSEAIAVAAQEAGI